MNQTDIVDKVIEVVRQVQDASGRTVEDISADTRPVEDIDGFDSLCGVEASALLSQALRCKIQDNAFLTQRDGRVLSVNEIAEKVQGQLSQRGLIS